MLQPLLQLRPNRVRRNYLGGALLDAFEGGEAGQDGHCPEDWIASTTRAVNPGMPFVKDEGISSACGVAGSPIALTELFASAPDFYLGPAHHGSYGTQLGFLAKLLDSAMRLHVQAHPTAAFARQHLGSRWGKLEAYVILGVRGGCEPYIRLGFQRPPSPLEWRRIVLEQDIGAMDACFDPVPVRIGEVWFVPGGLPHAIGPGVLMLEVMEPTDLVVRCEFEREGVVVPEEGRFMNRDPDFALQIFDYTPLSTSQVTDSYRVRPAAVSETETRLIGPEHTGSFSVSRIGAARPAGVGAAGRLRIGVVAAGRGHVSSGPVKIPLRPGVRFLLAAAAPDCQLVPADEERLDVLICSPATPDEAKK